MMSSWPSVQPPNKAGQRTKKRLKNWELVKDQGSAIMLGQQNKHFRTTIRPERKERDMSSLCLDVVLGVNRAGHISCPEGYCLGGLGFLGAGKLARC